MKKNYHQIVTDCGKSPKIARCGISANELSAWCEKNNCTWREITEDAHLWLNRAVLISSR